MAHLRDVSGKVTVWRIENFERVAWPEALHGTFYSGDSFIAELAKLPRVAEIVIMPLGIQNLRAILFSCFLILF